MGAAFQLLGFALLIAWSCALFGWPWALFVAGVECLVVGVALSDVQLPRITRRRDEDV